MEQKDSDSLVLIQLCLMVHFVQSKHTLESACFLKSIVGVERYKCVQTYVFEYKFEIV